MSSPNAHMTDNIAASTGGSHHLAGVSLNGPLAVSLVAVSLVFIAVAVGSIGVLSSAFTGNIHDGQPKEVIDDLVAKHDQKLTEYQKRFEGRYIFYKPPPPPPPPRPPEQERPKPPPEPVDTTPKAPTTYQGPSIAWVIGDDVYFNLLPATATEKYMRLGVGQERNGVKVLSTEKLPRTVRVAHMGGEYDVKVFGDGMSSNALFPTSPRPSILIPGFIPEGQPAPIVAPATAETEAVTGGETPSATPAETQQRTDAANRGRPANGRSRGPRNGNGGGGGGGPGGGGGGGGDGGRGGPGGDDVSSGDAQPAGR